MRQAPRRKPQEQEMRSESHRSPVCSAKSLLSQRGSLKSGWLTHCPSSFREGTPCHCQKRGELEKARLPVQDWSQVEGGEKPGSQEVALACKRHLLQMGPEVASSGLPCLGPFNLGEFWSCFQLRDRGQNMAKSEITHTHTHTLCRLC